MIESPLTDTVYITGGVEKYGQSHCTVQVTLIVVEFMVCGCWIVKLAGVKHLKSMYIIMCNSN